MRLLGGDDGCKAALLERQHVNSVRLRINACRIANDVDEAVKSMQAAEQIIVFPIGPRQESGEMAEANALQAFNAVESGERAGILRADPVDQNLVEFANLARTRHREGQHVPEGKAEIIDKYLPARLRMPLGRIERSQQIVDFTRARTEVDLDGELLDQTVELGDVLLHKAGGIDLEMLDLRTRGRGGKNICRKLAHLSAVKAGILAAPQRVQPGIELTLELIDHERIKPREMVLIDELIKPILARDEEVHSPHAVSDIEGQEVFHPGGKMIRGLALEFERFAVGPFVDDAFVQRPGIDDFGHDARQRRLRGHAPQLHDQLSAERAHGGKLEPHIGLIGKAGVASDVRVNLLAPGSNLLARDRPIECRGHDFSYQLTDVGTGAVDDRPQSAHLLVEVDHARKLVDHRL